MRIRMAIACLTVGVVFFWLRGCQTPPAFTTEEEFRAADVLYTAVTAKQTRLVEQARQYIRELATSNRIAPASEVELERIVAITEDGDWDMAAVRLNRLIRSQDR